MARAERNIRKGVKEGVCVSERERERKRERERILIPVQKNYGMKSDFFLTISSHESHMRHITAPDNILDL